ncbi:MAG TPA: cysteinyl-tRNA synthetase, partial [Chloroflexi bacterium]|nr:cysteinyl-tRNA synthetase [Chloroflexota bacterium]
MNNPEPGLVVLFGSGEIAPGAQSIYDHLFRALARPIRLAILETPAGFELNSPQVAGRIADYVTHHLQNYRPDITVIPARHRDTPFSPDNPSIVEPLLESNAIFLGPGSPTYAIRHLRNSLAWHMLQARHRLGNAIIMASAATIASSAWALPVYEIYKVGEDPHWVPGLNLFGPFGLDLVFVPHWDNREGGDDLDTSRAFIGRSRFDLLRDQLPDETTIVGIDEHTALIIDIAQKMCRVMGRGGVTILREEAEQVHASGTNFPLAELGHCHDIDPE